MKPLRHGLCKMAALGLLTAFAAFGTALAHEAAPAGGKSSTVREDDSTPAKDNKAKRPAPSKKPVRRGSSSPPLVPPYRSPPAPPGPSIAAPTSVPGAAQPASPPTIVPGVRGHAGPALTPPRPAGETFQDRAVNCVHTGTAIGVSPGQIGTYTRHCVNR